MPRAIVFENPGDASVLKLVDVPLAQPAENQVRIKHTAIEVNFIDIQHRSGAYQFNVNPRIPGGSAVGVIEAVGSGIDFLKVGERVGYATVIGGAYAAARNIDARHVFRVPDNIDDKTAAAVLVKGLTAQYLATRVFVIRPGIGCLVHSAASGVGQLLSNWIFHRGGLAIGTVGSDEKISVAQSSGCYHVVNYNMPDWPQQVLSYLDGEKLHIVYDSLGRAVFDKSFECIRDMGLYVLYGTSSGPIPLLDTARLAAKSLYFTRPSLFHYRKDRRELVLAAEDLFQAVVDGWALPKVFAEFPLESAAEAHRLVESRKTMGSVILIP